jgi:hypothetical protein
MNAGLDAEIRPQPTAEELRALELALAERRDDGASPVAASRWRAAGLPIEDDYEVTARPPSSRGATRA